MLRIDVATIFPRMVEAGCAEGIVRRAVEAGLVDIRVFDLRDFTPDKHRSVDDSPFGGGPGMVMKAEPFFNLRDHLFAGPDPASSAVVLLSPRGETFDQRRAERYSRLERLVLLCGRYEGVDERVASSLATEEVSLGDFVLTGGETAALAVTEATVRLVPGALGEPASASSDSFSDGVLDWPHYTRPALFRGLAVPEVLLSGDHEKIRRWRRKEALRSTRMRRGDLMQTAAFSGEDRLLLEEIESESETALLEK